MATEAAETRLGAKRHDLIVADRNGRVVYQSSNNSLQNVAWGREYCNTSSAVATLIATPFQANQIEPWSHTMAVYRGDELVHYGIIRKVRARANMLELTALDCSVYWSKRRIAQPRVYRNKDASAVAVDVITDAIGKDDPLQQVDTLSYINSNLWMTMEVPVALKMVKDIMDDLEKQGLAWTVSAGRVILGPGPAQHTALTITDDHWSAEIEVVKEGDDVVTDVLTVGKGVFGAWLDPTTAMGSLQSIVKADSLVREEECVNASQRMVKEAQYPPRMVVVPSNTRLLPNAPVVINELIPGILIPVSSRQTGITVGSTMALKSVKVTADEKGESVQITLMEVPSNTNASLLPPPITEDYSSPYDIEMREKEQAQTDKSGATTATGQGPGPL